MSACEHDGTSLYCSCCNREKLAEIRPQEGLIIKDGRHGQHHLAFIGPQEVLIRLAGANDGSAVVDYVRRVFGG